MKKIPAVERKAEWEDVKKKYPHMAFTGQLKPAHHTIDKCHSTKVEGDLKYIPAHEVPTRDQELRNVKMEEMIKRDSNGHLRARDETKVPEADVRTDLRVRQAYSRRGLALEIADVMTYTCHEALVHKLFMEYQREPPQGYAGVSFKQVADADRRIWKILAESLAGDLGRDAAGNRVADEAMKKAMGGPAFLMMLLPLPGGRSWSSSTGEVDKTDDAVATGKRKLMKQNQALKEKLKASEAAREEAPDKKKIKPEVKKMPIKMPKELWGLQPM